MNIILIGFTACGKSTAGARLAEMTGRRFIDTDALVEDLYRDRYGEALSCRQLYARHGADLLRELETEVLRSLPAVEDSVIATGGGVVLREENVALLRRAGQCVFMDVPMDVLEKRLDRRASSRLFSGKSPAETYEERRPLYLAAAALHHPVKREYGREGVALSLLKQINEAVHGQ